MLTNIEIQTKLKEVNRWDLIYHSACSTNNFLGDFTSKYQPKNIIEIGTYNGLSTVLFASIAEELVYTFDIVYRNCEYIWNLFNIRHKIDNFIGTKEQIAYDIDYRFNRNQIKFDFAFIDGEHTYKAVKRDFALTERCGRVLFHDVDGEDAGRFLKEIGGKIVDGEGKFGYWEAK